MQLKINTNSFLLTLCLFVLSLGAVAKESSSKNIKDVFKRLSTIEKPFELRDPFKAPFARKKIDFSGEAKEEGKISTEQAMKTINIENIKVVGVLVGKDRRAVVKVKGLEGTFLVREGMIVGPEKAELKAILPGGIVLVEKIKNVYDDDEYIETVIPLSTN